jgi:hypothetical protein
VPRDQAVPFQSFVSLSVHGFCPISTSLLVFFVNKRANLVLFLGPVLDPVKVVRLQKFVGKGWSPDRSFFAGSGEILVLVKLNFL